MARVQGPQTLTEPEIVALRTLYFSLDELTSAFTDLSWAPKQHELLRSALRKLV